VVEVNREEDRNPEKPEKPEKPGNPGKQENKLFSVEIYK